MCPRRDFRDDATEGRVQRFLRSNYVGQRARSAGDDGRGRLVAGGFDRQDAPV